MPVGTFILIAAEQDRHADFPRQRAHLELPDRRPVPSRLWIALERKRRRRLRPDDVLRAAADHVARHGDVGRENPARLFRPPLERLFDVALHESDAYGCALTDERTVADPPGPPARDRHEQDTGNR